MKLINADELRDVFARNSGTYVEEAMLGIIDSQPVAYDLDMVLDQLEDYGKYRGTIFYSGDDNSGDNYIPVSVAKQIVRGRGLGGILGDMEDNICLRN